jgi:2-polyprenyl-3-methyl-5-hydroxy-6-metoxy-1,4-benzoquinol methylase
MDQQTGELALAALGRAREAIGTAEAMVRQAMDLPDAQKAPKAKEGPKKPKFHVAESLSAHLLGPTPDLTNEDWPQAVSPYMIVRTDIEKQFRAVQVVGLIPMALEGMNVLDCGCGEGHIAGEIAARARHVVAYDPVRVQTWRDKTNLIHTDDLGTVTEKGPYDAIILYDVLDHLEGESPTTLLAKLRDLLTPNGRIFLRTHPWTAKHGSHLYEANLNKAYAHLALTPDELVIAGFDVKPNLKVVRPMAAYEQFAKTAGFKVLDRKGHNDPVEPFFSGDLLDRIIKVTWKGDIQPDDALKIMSNSFIDYTLGRS